MLASLVTSWGILKSLEQSLQMIVEQRVVVWILMIWISVLLLSNLLHHDQLVEALRISSCDE
jgi:hypothetical protein